MLPQKAPASVKCMSTRENYYNQPWKVQKGWSSHIKVVQMLCTMCSSRKGNKGPVHANLSQRLSESALSLQSGKASYHLHTRGKTVKPSSMAVQSGTWKVSVQRHSLHFTCVSLVQVTAAQICRWWSFCDQPHAPSINFWYWDCVYADLFLLLCIRHKEQAN